MVVDEYLSNYQEEVYNLDEAAEVITERMLRLEEVQEEDKDQVQHENIGRKAREKREQAGTGPEIQRHTERATLRRAGYLVVYWTGHF